MENLNQSLEARIEDLEKALNEIMVCLGLRLIKSPDGRVGYKVPRQGPQEGWGILAKIIYELDQLKDQKRIIIPGR